MGDVIYGWLPGGSMVTWWSEFVLSTICDHVLHDHDMIVSNMGFARERELKVEKLWNIVFVSCMNWWKAKLVWFEHILKIFPHCADSFELLHSEIFFKKHWFLPSPLFSDFILLKGAKGDRFMERRVLWLQFQMSCKICTYVIFYIGYKVNIH